MDILSGKSLSFLLVLERVPSQSEQPYNPENSFQKPLLGGGFSAQITFLGNLSWAVISLSRKPFPGNKQFLETFTISM